MEIQGCDDSTDEWGLLSLCLALTNDGWFPFLFIPWVPFTIFLLGRPIFNEGIFGHFYNVSTGMLVSGDQLWPFRLGFSMFDIFNHLFLKYKL